MADQVPDGAGKKAEADTQKEAESKRSYSEEEFKKLVSERDKAKERLRLIDEAAKKAEEEKLVAEGKAKELLTQKESELAELRSKASLYEEQQKSLRESLLAKLSDEADKIAGESITDLSKLQKYVDLRQSKQAGPHDGKGSPVAAAKPERLKLDLSRSAGKDFDRVREDLRGSGIAQ